MSLIKAIVLKYGQAVRHTGRICGWCKKARFVWWNASQGMPETNIQSQSYFIIHNENESMFLRH